MIARWALPIVSLLMALPAAAQTKQQTYDAAQAAFDKGEWAAAEAGFAKLLAPAGRSSRSDGVIRSRYATALGRLGREQEALGQARRALGELGNAAPDEERAVAALTLAKLLHVDFEAGAAADAYEIARDAALPDSGLKLTAALGAIQALAVADPARAIRIADATIGGPVYAAASKEQQAYIHSLKARAQLNAGEANAAKMTIAKAVAMTGAMSTKVNLLQSIVRGDAALIYARAGSPDKAREYLAYSGGGYLPTTDWWGDGNRQPPVCDDEVKPDDVAVVAFQLDEQGKPVGAETVYASRPGPMGTAFARAVKGWDASPTVGKLSAFWRSTLRIEMRCVTRPAPIAIAETFRDEAAAWWHARGSKRSAGDLAELDGKADPADDALFADLRRIAKTAGADARPLMIDDALVKAAAPPEVRAFAVLGPVLSQTGKLIGKPVPDALPALVSRFAATPNGTRAAAWLQLEAGIALEKARRVESARGLLAAVLSQPEDRLAGDDAIRMLATLHLSMIDRRSGDQVTADSRLKTAGLDARQCSLFDVRPLAVNRSVSDTIFPVDAMRWGFDGYVKEAFDIAADGHVAGVRTIIAYPAFVFADASEKAIGHFRFQPPTLDGEVLGCAAQTQAFSFRTPR